MSTALFAGLVAGLVAGGLFAWLRRRRAATTTGADEPRHGATARRRAGAAAPPPGHAATSSFRAVVIRPGRGCCAAVRALAGRPTLVGEAPALPVAGCDRPQCSCTFQRLSDRRAGDERRFSLAGFGGFGANGRPREQRTGRDRRRD